MRTILNQEKTQVEARISELLKPEEPMDNPDQEDIAMDAAEDILEQSLLNVHREALEKIENAILRINDGTYGRCIECGAEIPEEDLLKEPWAEHCKACRK